jgi:hypothetical protein
MVVQAIEMADEPNGPREKVGQVVRFHDDLSTADRIKRSYMRCDLEQSQGV